MLSVSYGVPLSSEELFEVDDDPDAKPNTSTPELRRAFEVTFRFWNKQYVYQRFLLISLDTAGFHTSLVLRLI